MNSAFLSRFGVASLVFVLANLFAIGFARASALGEIGLHFSSSRTEDASGGANSTRSYRANIAMGWLSELNRDETEQSIQTLGYGLVLRTERGFQSSSTIAGYGLGIFLGYYAGPFSVRVDYYALAEQQANNGQVETSFREGSGYAVNLRWLHWFETVNGAKNRVGVGPSLVFEQLSYAKTRIGSLPESSNARSTDSLAPGIVGLFYF